MAREDIYKLYQLSSILISKYNFRQFVIQQLTSNQDEVWLINENDENYNLIRITFNNANTFAFEKDRINDYLKVLKGSLLEDIRFLDIHISSEEYDKDLEPYDYINIEENYFKGTDLSNIYPEIYQSIHKVDNRDKEISKINDLILKTIQEKRKEYIKANRPYFTYIIMAICSIIYLICFLLARKYTDSTVYIFMGASYNTFTLGLKQLYRLITSGFVHGGFIHLLSNMYSLYYLGAFVERRYGYIRYLIVMFVSILVGTLSQSIFSSNTMILGISGALYAFMFMFMIEGLMTRRINFMQILPIIFINISINFISTTAWVAHLGGLLTGYLFYLIYSVKENKKYIILLVVLIAVLMIKYLTTNTIEPLYLLTDQEIVKMLNDFGFKKYSVELWNRLLKVYSKYGG